MAAVERFYEKVLADPRTRPFFEGLPIALQTQKQVAFMAWAFGGPAEYKGRDLREAHAKLVQQKGLSDAQFDAVVQLLEETLRELGVTEDLVIEARTLVAGTRDQVLGRAS
jgi:hemoglobin